MRSVTLGLLLLVCVAATADEVRQWRAGDFTERGTFVSLVKDSVTIRLLSGAEVEVDLSSLSTSDQAYVRVQALKQSPFRRKMAGADGGIESLENSIGIKFVRIPAGTFTMGDLESHQTPHQVTLTKPFYLGVYEVTNAQWKRVMGKVPSHWKEDALPVEQVTSEDVVQFCQKLSAMPEERKAGRNYRLPSEAEWEFACRAGTNTQYSFGDDKSALKGYAWFDGNSGGEPHPVGQKKPNFWGLYDMHGNVQEWCIDGRRRYESGNVTDPRGPSDADERVQRGGSWRCSASQSRSADRGGWDPTFRYDLGFRLAMSPSGVEPPEAAAGR
jgi:formylglycine-generating enzyme required for sulfatase activity